MARIKGALATRKRRNKTLKLAKGYWGGKSRLFKTARKLSGSQVSTLTSADV